MHTKNLFITLSTLLLLASTTLDAKTPKEPCSTSVECDAMAEDLQGKIDVLEAKGLENLTDDEFRAPLKIPSTNLITSTSQITFNNEIKTSIKKHPRAS